MRALVGPTLALLLASGCPARADDLPAASDQAAIRDVISQQLDAFSTDNGAAAKAFASPGIKDKFPTPESFMAMVRGSYAALIRPRSTHFDEMAQTPLGLVQKMTIVDGSGQNWTAAYTMTLIDGQWRISGCFILRSEAVST